MLNLVIVLGVFLQVFPVLASTSKLEANFLNQVESAVKQSWYPGNFVDDTKLLK